jgi:nitroreductase
LAAIEFSDVLRKRRMTRHFKSQLVPDEILRRIVDAGNRAPTASNASYRRLMLVRDPRILQLFRNVALGYSESKAAAIIVIYTDLNVVSAGGNRAHVPWTSGMDAGAAAENIHLAAVNMGLGSCFFPLRLLRG